MAEASGPPTFKLVLVGDGGTGKVGQHSQAFLAHAPRLLSMCLTFKNVAPRPHKSRLEIFED